MDSIGKYTILEVIGRGGMGTVYRARDTVISRDVAIKVIAEHVASLPKVKERLYQEATSAGRLSHENIMTIFDVGEKEGAPFLVMELLDGRDLRSTVDSGDVMSFERKIDLALQICRGLAYAHARGVVHRDIKPENIRILSSGRVKILDFGIARVESETRTMTHSSIGTPRYMSPEQVRGKDVDQRTDIFSFGVLLYELLSGVNPFDGSHVTAVIYKILHEEPEPVSVDDPRLSADVQRIVGRCLEKDAAKRYSDFPTVIKDLEKVLAKQQSRASTVLDDLPAPLVQEESTSSGSEAAGGKTGRSLLTAGQPAAGEETAILRESSVSDGVPPARRPRWLIPAAAAVVLMVSLGGYFALTAGSRDGGEPERPITAVAGDPAAVELVELRERALRLRDEVAVEKSNAEPWRDTDALSSLYKEALDSQRVALGALEEQTMAAYERSAEAFLSAKNTFRAISAAGKNDLSAMRGQAEASRQAMERARRQVNSQKSSPIVADAFARAEAALRKGDGHFEAGEYPAALVSFGQAEAGFIDVGKRLERAAAAEEGRLRAGAAQQQMEELRTRVAPWREAPGNAAAFEEGERLRRDGISLAEAARYEEALAHFGRAEAAFANVKEPVVPATSGNAATANQARTAMQQSKAGIPADRRTYEQFGEGSQTEQRGQDAYGDGRFDTATELFRQAERLYTAVAALPAPKTAEDEVRESLVPLLNRFKVGLQEEDAEGLRRLHSFLGAYSAMFDVAEDIRADIGHSDINIFGNRATVAVTVDMSYKNNTQRMRPEKQNVKLLWTLEETAGGQWQLREITRQ